MARPACRSWRRNRLSRVGRLEIDSMMSRTWRADRRSRGVLASAHRAKSNAPMPRPSALPSAGNSVQSASVGASNHSFGEVLFEILLADEHSHQRRSGRASGCARCAMDFELACRDGLVKAESWQWRSGPEANSSSAEICVSTVTSKVSPAASAADRPLVLGSPAKAGDRLYGAVQELDERSEVVGPMSSRGPPPLEKKLWIWMPASGPEDSQRWPCRDRGAYAAGLDHSASASPHQEGVGRIAQLDSGQQPPR